MSSALVRHGREIVFQPQLFARQHEQLKAEVKCLKQELDQQSLLQLSGNLNPCHQNSPPSQGRHRGDLPSITASKA